MPTNETAWLALYLDAPLQSWGYQSRFDRRTTLPYPTRSGVIGLISAAMGIDRGDTHALRRFDVVQITVLTFRHGPSMIDFHTVGGGYDRLTEKRFIVHTAQNKLRPPGQETVVTHREFLQHAKYGAIVIGPPIVIVEIADALIDPVWGIWLGRKACVPASPVHQGIFDTFTDALCRLEEVSGCRALRSVREVDDFADGTDTLMDRPLDFRKRDYAPRRVKVEH